MSDHSVDRHIYDLQILNEEAEQLIDEIEPMRMEEEKIDEIRNEDRHYGGEDKYLQIASR